MDQVQSFSVAKLCLVHALSNQRQAQRDLRSLIIASAAAAGGDAVQTTYRFLEKQLHADCSADARPAPQSQIPLSSEDFQRMLTSS